MSVNSILGKAFMVNTTLYNSCPKDVSIECDRKRVDGVYYFVPVFCYGALTGYAPTMRSEDAGKPGVVKTVRVKDLGSNQLYYILVNEADGPALIHETCNACCDTLTPLPDVTITDPVYEEEGCCVLIPSDCNYDYDFFAPTATDPYVYKVWINGTMVHTAEYATVAAFITYATASLSTYGTWSATGNKIHLHSETVTSAAIEFLEPSGG